MQCKNHSQEEAVGACVYCGKLYCQNCLIEVDSRYYCKEHVEEAIKMIKYETGADISRHDAAKDHIIINNTLTHDASSKMKLKNHGIINSHGPHLFFQMLMGMGTMGFFGLALVCIVRYAEIGAIFFMGLAFISLILLILDRRYCKRF